MVLESNIAHDIDNIAHDVLSVRDIVLSVDAYLLNHTPGPPCGPQDPPADGRGGSGQRDLQAADGSQERGGGGDQQHLRGAGEGHAPAQERAHRRGGEHLQRQAEGQPGPPPPPRCCPPPPPRCCPVVL